jgi:anti-anti-sigma factor
MFGRPFVETPIHDKSGHKRVIFLQLEGDLFFGVADELQDRLTRLAHSGVRVAILRLKRTHSVDATALHVLEKFAQEMRDREGYVILCGVKTELMDDLRGYGLVDLIGRENVFPAGGQVFESAKLALARARELTAASIDTLGLEAEIADEPVTYEI